MTVQDIKDTKQPIQKDDAEIALHQAKELISLLFEAYNLGERNPPFSQSQISSFLAVVEEKITIGLDYVDGLDIPSTANDGGRHAA